MSSTDQSVADSLPVFAAGWQDSDADMILISSDNVKFAVHRLNLRFGSAVFRDMCEVSGSENGNSSHRPEVELTESAVVLQKVLPYLYTENTQDFEIDEHLWDAVGTCLKYSMTRGIEAIVYALIAVCIDHDQGTLFRQIEAFRVGRRIENKLLQKVAIQRIMKLNPTHRQLLEVAYTADKGQPDGDPALVLICDIFRRRALLAEIQHMVRWSGCDHICDEHKHEQAWFACRLLSSLALVKAITNKGSYSLSDGYCKACAVQAKSVQEIVEEDANYTSLLPDTF